MNLTIKPFGRINPKVLEHLCEELHDMAEVSLSAPETVPDSFVRRNRDGEVQYLATEFEKAMAPEKGDRVLAVTDVDLFDHGLNFVFGHATIRDRFAVISIARRRQPSTSSATPSVSTMTTPISIASCISPRSWRTRTARARLSARDAMPSRHLPCPA